MLEIRDLIRFFDTGFVLKLFILFLLLSLIPVGEMFFLMYADSYVNIYVLLGSVMAVSFLGFLLAYWRVALVLKKIKRDIKNDIYPEKSLMQLAGSFTASIFLIFPGFISFLLGVVMLLPGVTRRIGILFNNTDNKTKALYEYLKLYDF